MALTKEDLQAISGLMDEKLQPINERLDGIDGRLDGMDKRFDKVEERLDGMDERLDGMDKRFDKMETEMSEMKQMINRNYELTEEFYVHQKEANTKLQESMEELSARVIIFENQTVKNTAELDKYRAKIMAG